MGPDLGQSSGWVNFCGGTVTFCFAVARLACVNVSNVNTVSGTKFTIIPEGICSEVEFLSEFSAEETNLYERWLILKEDFFENKQRLKSFVFKIFDGLLRLVV